MHDILSTNRVHDFNSLRVIRGNVTNDDPVKFARRANAKRNMTGIVNVAAGNDPSAAPIHAEIQRMHTSWGPRARWVAVCECHGAEDVTPDYPWFFCLSCLNVPHDGKWRPMVFPKPSEREEIEALILARDDSDTWAYTPGETIAELTEQNRVIAARGR